MNHFMSLEMTHAQHHQRTSLDHFYPCAPRCDSQGLTFSARIENNALGLGLEDIAHQLLRFTGTYIHRQRMDGISNIKNTGHDGYAENRLCPRMDAADILKAVLKQLLSCFIGISLRVVGEPDDSDEFVLGC